MNGRGKNPKTVWWNDEIKYAVRRKEDAWKEVMAASEMKRQKKNVWKHSEKRRERLKCVYIRGKRN